MWKMWWNTDGKHHIQVPTTTNTSSTTMASLQINTEICTQSSKACHFASTPPNVIWLILVDLAKEIWLIQIVFGETEYKPFAKLAKPFQGLI